MKTATSVRIRRSLDSALRRQPLRLEITRRRRPASTGSPRFVTQVHFAGSACEVVPRN
jgi:hypothetical protein